MSRLFYGIMFALSLSICPLTIGCGGGGENEVIEQDVEDTEAEAAEIARQEEEATRRNAASAEDDKDRRSNP